MTGISPTLLSQEIGVCNSTLHLYMHGVKNIRIETLRLICAYFKVTTDAILLTPINEEARLEHDKNQRFALE